jgi:hypothetical protein
MAWSATRILWDQQVMLLWIVLPPVFAGAAFLPVAARLLFNNHKRSRTPEKLQTTRVAVERV